MTRVATQKDVGELIDDLLRRVSRLEQNGTTAAFTALPSDPSFTTVTVGSTSPLAATSNAVTAWTATFPKSSIFQDQLYLDLSWTASSTANEYEVEVAQKVSGVYQLPKKYRTSGTTLRIEDKIGGARLVPGVTYGVRVYAINRLGVSSTPWPSSGYTDITLATDTGAPAAPTGVTATTGLRSIVVTWNDNTDLDLDGYELTVATNAAFSTGVRTTIVRGSIGGFQDLVTNTNYYVRVRAFDKSGNFSGYTNFGAPTAVPTGFVVNNDIAAAAVTAAKLSVNIGGGNLLKNSALESDTDNDGLPDGGFGNYSGSGAIAFSLVNGGVFGSKAFQWVATSVAAGQHGASVNNGAQFPDGTVIDATPFRGQTVTFSVYRKVTANASGATINPQLIIRDAGNGFVGSINLPTTTTTDSAWTRISGSVAVPVTATYFQIYLTGTNGSTWSATVQWDAMQLEVGDVLTAYAPNPAEILPGTIQNNMLGVGAVTYDKTSLAIPGVNMVPNSSFEGPVTTAGTYVTPDKWQVDSSGSAGINPNTGVTATTGLGFGSQYLRINLSTSTWTNQGYYGYRTINQITGFVAGQRVQVSGYVNLGLGANLVAQIYVQWYDASNNAIATGSGAIVQVAASNAGFTRYTGSTTVPANGVKCHVWCIVRATGTAVGSSDVQFDAVQIEVGDYVSAYGPAVSELVADAVTSVSIRDGAVVAGKLSANSVVAGNIVAGTITGDRIAAGTISAERLTVGSLGADLLGNGSFEDLPATGATATNPVAKWTRASVNGSVSVQQGTAFVRSGTKSLQITCNSNGAGTNVDMQSDKFPVEFGKTYACELSYYLDNVTWASGIYVYFNWYTAAGAYISSNAVLNNVGVSANTWTTGSQAYTPPATAAQASIGIQVVSPPANANVYFDNVRVNEQINSVRIADGAVIAQTIAADAVTATKILAGAVVAGKIAANAITSNEIAAGTITAARAQIADGTITSAKIVDANITTAKIANLAVDNAKIATLAVDDAKIANLAVLNAKIGTLAVTDAKINDLNVSKLVAGNIATADIQISGTASIFTDGTSSAGVVIDGSGISVYNTGGTRTIFLDGNTGSGTFYGTISAGTGLTAPLISGGTITGALLQSSSSNPRAYLDTTDIAVVNSSGVTIFKVGSSQNHVIIPGGAVGDLSRGIMLSGTGRYMIFSKGTPGVALPAIIFDLLETDSKIIFDPTNFDYVGYTSRQVQVSGGSGFLGLAVKGTTPGQTDFSGDWGGSGAGIRGRGGHTISMAWTGATIDFYVNSGGVVKSFVIDHPEERDKLLVHACLEGPDQAEVFYRGRGETDWRGQTWCGLPDYFEALCEQEGRDVWLQARFNRKHEPSKEAVLEAGDIVAGGFEVKGAPHTEFSWVVFARRRGTRFQTEPLRSSVTVKGTGPYTYIAA